MHGAKTYLGLASDWGKTWDEDHFTDVTGDDVTYDGSLTVKSGSVGDVTVNGSSSSLTVQGGTMGAVSCDGPASVKDGEIKSLEAGGNVAVSGGNIRHDVTSGEKATLSSTVKIGGNLEADEVVLSSGSTVNVTGTIKAGTAIDLNSCKLKTAGLDGDDTGTLKIIKYTATLPPLSNLNKIDVGSGATATADEKVKAGTLEIESNAEFSTSSSLELDTLEGPGTLYYHAGKLTVHDSITGRPFLIFSNSVSKGDVAFYSDSDSISEDDVRIYDYGLESEESSGSTVKYVFTNSITNGITLSSQTLSLTSGTSATVKASVKPDFSKFATGTKIVWKLYGDTSAFSQSVDSNGFSCKVSAASSASGMCKATLIAYLVDSHGDRLEDYKSDSCILSAGYSNSNSDGSFTLDTDAVSILTGDRYCVLAKTSSAAAPHAMSYNSSVATVGTGTAVKDSSGNAAWLYAVTGTGKGQVTIDIGGQKMVANVSKGITIDTSSYTMAPGGKYVVGVKASGVGDSSIHAFSDSSCVEVQKAGTGKNIFLYRLTGKSAGSATVTFSLTNGGSVYTQVTVQNGVKASGVSSRLVALA